MEYLATALVTEYSVCEQLQPTTCIRALHPELLYKGQTVKNSHVLIAPHSATDLPAVIRYLLCYYTLKGHLEFVLYIEAVVQPLQLMLSWAGSQPVMIRLWLALSSPHIESPTQRTLLLPSMWNHCVSTA